MHLCIVVSSAVCTAWGVPSPYQSMDTVTKSNSWWSMQYEIDDHLKDRVKLAVDRSTHASKLRDFQKWTVAVKKDTLHRVCWWMLSGITIIHLFYIGFTWWLFSNKLHYEIQVGVWVVLVQYFIMICESNWSVILYSIQWIAVAIIRERRFGVFLVHFMQSGPRLLARWPLVRGGH